MKPLRKEARLKIARSLQIKLSEVNGELTRNKRHINALAERQALLKKQRQELTIMINTLRGE